MHVRRVLLALLGASFASCGGGGHEYLESADIERAVVTSGSGARLVDYCGSSSESLTDAVQFRASPGEAVTFEYVEDSRDNWTSAPSDRHPTSFWCAGGGESGANAGLLLAKCFQTVGDDPPATLDKVEERGKRGGVIGTTGYALFMTVLHPGVLEIGLDLECTRNVYGQSYTSSPTWQVLTILPP